MSDEQARSQADPQTDPQTHLAPDEPDPASNRPSGEDRDGDMGVSSERVGPVGGGRGTIGTVPTYDDPAARPRSTGPNGSVPAPDESIEVPTSAPDADGD